MDPGVFRLSADGLLDSSAAIRTAAVYTIPLLPRLATISAKMKTIYTPRM